MDAWSLGLLRTAQFSSPNCPSLDSAQDDSLSSPKPLCYNALKFSLFRKAGPTARFFFAQTGPGPRGAKIIARNTVKKRQKKRMKSTSAPLSDTTQTPTPPKADDRLMDLISSLIEPQGFEVVHLEVINQRQKTLRVFIDRLNGAADHQRGGIGIQDCVDVTRLLDEPLEQSPEVEAIFKGPYELEVSSPGVERPLRKEKDFVRFAGREARIHSFRPLSVEELGGTGSSLEAAAVAHYQVKNPKQKNFLGVLKGVENGKVLLTVLAGGESGSPKKTAKQKKPTKTGEGPNSKEPLNAQAALGVTLSIPLALISKANLEPKFDFDSSESGEEAIVL